MSPWPTPIVAGKVQKYYGQRRRHSQTNLGAASNGARTRAQTSPASRLTNRRLTCERCATSAGGGRAEEDASTSLLRRASSGRLLRRGPPQQRRHCNTREPDPMRAACELPFPTTVVILPLPIAIGIAIAIAIAGDARGQVEPLCGNSWSAIGNRRFRRRRIWPPTRRSLSSLLLLSSPSNGPTGLPRKLFAWTHFLGRPKCNCPAARLHAFDTIKQQAQLAR